MKIRAIIAIVVGVVVVAGSIALITWRALQPPPVPHDAGLLEDLPQWHPAEFPMTIILDTAVDQPRVREAFGRAIPYFDGLFLPLGEVGSGQLVPVMPTSGIHGTADGDHPFGRAQFRIDPENPDDIVAVTILIDEMVLHTVNDEQLERALAHELGHVTGLAHDDDPASLMYPVATEDMGLAPLTAQDRQLLETLYRGERHEAQ